MENSTLVILAILGAVVSPAVTALGLLLQYRKDKKKSDDEKIEREAAAKKLDAEARKIEAEAHALDTKTDLDTINFYIGMVNTLREEVNNLTELSRKNGGEIAILTARLIQSDTEKAKLAKDNAELVREVQELRAEVDILRQQSKENRNV